MSWRVSLTRSAARELEALPEQMFNRLNAAILTLEDGPFQPQTKKLREVPHGYRLRVGDYRVLYVVESKEREMTIYGVRHRREAYR